jgi:hypothetical protein
MLETQVRSKDAPDIPDNALYINCKNAGVNTINEAKLEKLEGREYQITASIAGRTQNSIKPRVNNDGSINNTPLQHVLKLKNGAKVMLTYNVDVMDSMANGALGEVVGFDFNQSGDIKTVLVHFYDEKVGRERRKSFATLQSKYLGQSVTPIEKIEFAYSLSKKSTSSNTSVSATQFPLKLSFSSTAHKMQVTI